MSITTIQRLGIGSILCTLLIVVGLALDYSQKAITTGEVTTNVFAPIQLDLQKINQLISDSGSAFLRFIHRDRIIKEEVSGSFERLVRLEGDLIARLRNREGLSILRDRPARAARAAFHSFSEEEGQDPADDTTVELKSIVLEHLVNVRIAALEAAQIPQSPSRPEKHILTYSNLLSSAESLFQRYTLRDRITLNAAIRPIVQAILILDRLPIAALNHHDNHQNLTSAPESEISGIDAIRKVLIRYRSGLYSLADSEATMETGSAFLESRDAAELALYNAQNRVAVSTNILGKHLQALQEDTLAAGRHHQRVFLILAVMTLCLSLVFSVWIGSIVSRRIRLLVNAVKSIAAGDLELRVEEQGTDSFGQLATEFNTMARELREKDEALARRIAELDDARRHLHEANEDLEGRVAKRTTELLVAMQEAEAANRAKSDFLANMSHELRTPLNAIIGYAELLQEEAEDRDDKALTKDLGKVRNAGRHLLGLISNVLDLSKVEAGKMEVDLQETRLDALLAEIDDTVRHLVTEKGNVFEVTSTATVAAFTTDAQKLRQMLLNLLGNAAKFTRDGEVQLAVTEDPAGSLNFVVSDTGVGMGVDQLSKVLEPFTQADTDVTRKYGGTGLGLAITKSYAELLGGRLNVESDPGHGSRFTVTLPIHRVDAAGASALNA